MSVCRRGLRLVSLTMAALVLGLAATANADTIYVCWDGSGDYLTIQEGIDAASDGDEVIVCDGVYTGPGNKNLDFGGKAITVRSTTGPENCIIDCEGSGRGFYFHNGETGASIVNGFTITDAYLHEEDGAGVYCSGSSPTITNCTITGNMADYASGGGICCAGSNAVIADCTITANSHNGIACFGGGPRISNCTISDNWATIMVFGTGVYCLSSNAMIMNCTIAGNTGGVSGGGVCCFGGSPVITNTTITGNWAYLAGGGIACWEASSLTVTNCTIAGNTVDFDIGGGIYCWESSIAEITNCMIVGNSADYRGGGIGCEEAGSVTATNCTVAGNTVAYGSGGAVWCRAGGSATVTNCILWGDSPDEIDGPAVVTYSDVEGGFAGEGNIDADPLFVDPESEDYHLGSGSPCIDAGDNDAVPSDTFDLDEDGDTDEPIPYDLDGNPRFVDDPDTPDTGNGEPPIVDMGAYEFQAGPAAFLDMKPGSCPNALNRNSHGVCPAALVGTEHFDVTQVDLDSLELTRADGVGGSVTPLMGPPGPGIHVEDVATPFDGEPCDCHELEGDGIADLAMKFDTPEMVAVLELDDLPGGSSVELVVSGELLDTTYFSAPDCVVLVPPGSGSGALPVQSGPEGDGVAAVPKPPPDRRLADPDAAQDGGAPDEMSPQLVGCGVLPPGFLLTATAAMYLISRSRPVARLPE